MDIDQKTREEVRHKVRDCLTRITLNAEDDPMYPQPLRDSLNVIREAAKEIGQEMRKVGA